MTRPNSALSRRPLPLLALAVLGAALALAAILGDSTNYWIGYFLGPKVFRSQGSRWLNPEYLDRTHAFYEKYGGKTIIFAKNQHHAEFIAERTAAGDIPKVQGLRGDPSDATCESLEGSARNILEISNFVRRLQPARIVA